MVDAKYTSTAILDASKIIALKGNKCGHVQSSPREFEKPSHHKTRKPIINKAQRLLKQLFFNPLEAFVNPNLFYHAQLVTKHNRFRKKRGEQRAAITHRFGAALLHCVNLKDMVLGFTNQQTGEYNFLSIKYLAKIASISYHQARMAFKSMKIAGYVSMQERKTMLANGTYRSQNPILRVNPQFFYDIGISEDELQKDRYNEMAALKQEEISALSSSYKQSQRIEQKRNKTFKKQQIQVNIENEQKQDFIPKIIPTVIQTNPLSEHVEYIWAKIRATCNLKPKPS